MKDMNMEDIRHGRTKSESYYYFLLIKTMLLICR